MPFAAIAQQGRRMPRIGFISLISREADHRVSIFLEGLRELGYVEGKTIAIEWRFPGGNPPRLAEYAADLARSKPDLIVAVNPQAVEATRRVTFTIPIVFIVGQDPVGMGWAKSLSRPGGNITGHSSMVTDLGAKQLELLRLAIPNCSRVAVLLNPTNPAGTAVMRRAFAEGAQRFNVALRFFEARTRDEIELAFAAAKAGQPDAVIVGPDGFFFQERAPIAELALRHRVATLFLQRDHVSAGGLMSYGPNAAEQYRRAAFYVDRILKGAKPAELPIEQPSKIDLVFNLKTARALGLSIPESLLVRADEVLQ